MVAENEIRQNEKGSERGLSFSKSLPGRDKKKVLSIISINSVISNLFANKFLYESSGELN